MVVGQTGGGKSVILQTLARAQTKMGKRTTMNILNPKVCIVQCHPQLHVSDNGHLAQKLILQAMSCLGQYESRRLVALPDVLAAVGQRSNKSCQYGYSSSAAAPLTLYCLEAKPRR